MLLAWQVVIIKVTAELVVIVLYVAVVVELLVSCTWYLLVKWFSPFKALRKFQLNTKLHFQDTLFWQCVAYIHVPFLSSDFFSVLLSKSLVELIVAVMVVDVVVVAFKYCLFVNCLSVFS